MRRLNSEGLDRNHLIDALGREWAVRRAIRMNSCLLCRNSPVTSAGLCEGCLANLTDEEVEAARPWIEGTRF